MNDRNKNQPGGPRHRSVAGRRLPLAPGLRPAAGAAELVDAGRAGRCGRRCPGTPLPGSRGDFLQSVPSDRVFFDFDSYALDDGDRTTLDAQADWLARNPAVNVTIEGHADERGTREYNLALGDRRANAARDYLQSRGVAASRMQTISWGKERPAVPESNEYAWSQNRRAVTVVPE
jgi:peptidoglycan-associated lipoprotein